MAVLGSGAREMMSKAQKMQTQLPARGFSRSSAHIGGRWHDPPMSRDELIQSACAGKQPFATPALARKVASKAKHNGIEAYKCRWCKAWHVGFTPKTFKRPTRG